MASLYWGRQQVRPLPPQRAPPPGAQARARRVDWVPSTQRSPRLPPLRHANLRSSRPPLCRDPAAEHGRSRAQGPSGQVRQPQVEPDRHPGNTPLPGQRLGRSAQIGPCLRHQHLHHPPNLAPGDVAAGVLSWYPLDTSYHLGVTSVHAHPRSAPQSRRQQSRQRRDARCPKSAVSSRWGWAVVLAADRDGAADAKGHRLLHQRAR